MTEVAALTEQLQVSQLKCNEAKSSKESIEVLCSNVLDFLMKWKFLGWINKVEEAICERCEANGNIGFWNNRMEITVAIHKSWTLYIYVYMYSLYLLLGCFERNRIKNHWSYSGKKSGR